MPLLHPKPRPTAEPRGPKSPTTPKLPKSPSSVPAILLNKYKFGDLLGWGSFAKVYSAKSLIDGAEVAIKIIDKSIISSAGMESQIILEIDVMRRLEHPNIIRIHEVLATKTKIFLVMEYARGGDLFKKLSRHRKFSEPIARKYFQQLVKSIHFCHVHGVVHRDIKPQNLLLDLEGNLKVSDFGLSALEEPGLFLQTACGTPAYTAPEVVGRKGYIGAKADAWSCGVILFVFLAGGLPFDDSNLLAMYKKINRREFEFPPWFSRSVKRVISRLLDPNPVTRMSIEELMEVPWLKMGSRSEMNLYDLNKMQPKEKAPVMNAFDIISMSSGLDLSSLFDGGKKKEKRFTSTCSPEVILETVEKVGGKLGYTLQKRDGGHIGLVKGRLIVRVEVLEVAKELFLVNMKLSRGDGLELEEESWEDLKAGLSDVVLAWQHETA